MQAISDALIDEEANDILAVAGAFVGAFPGEGGLFRQMFDVLPVAIYATDTDGRITYFNQAAASLWGCSPQIGASVWCGSWKLFWPDGTPMPHDQCPMATALKESRPIRGIEAVVERPDGTRVPFMPFPTPLRDTFGTVVGAVNMLIDIGERKANEEVLRNQARRLEVLNEVAKAVSANLDLDQIIQTVTDRATEVSGAEFGAFFCNAGDDRGEHYTLRALSGASKAAFEAFGSPRNTALFGQTFRGEGVLRSDDVRAHSRYGKNAPHFGTPVGHLPVVSYLAVPVISRSGEVHGGLFFGHGRPGVFTTESEEIVASIAQHAAIAIDNGRLFQLARAEAERRRCSEQAAQRLAAVVESSDDAILTLDLGGTITSWNRGAERIFGYGADEVVGTPLTILIPPDRQDEEIGILARIRRGERIEHYETVRRCKDGSLLEISLTVSPLRNLDDTIVGASKIARVITERRRLQEQQRLILREMDHRVKNLFALSSSIVSLSARSAMTPADLVRDVQERLGALARAHALTLAMPAEDGLAGQQPASLHALVRTIVSPYDERAEGGNGKIAIHGADLALTPSSVTGWALLLHEFATNAAKYGALSRSGGHVDIACDLEGDRFVLTWTERGGPRLEDANQGEGFGSVLVRAAVKGQLRGELSRMPAAEGVVIRISVPNDLSSA